MVLRIRKSVFQRAVQPASARVACLRDTFRIAFERIEQFRNHNLSIFFWLRRIAINLTIAYYRKQNRDERLAEKILANESVVDCLPSAAPPPDQNLFDENRKQMIAKSLDKIKERFAKVLRLRLLEERSREECAEILGVTINNFDVIFHRACKAFRDNYPP